jgi:hypothetical protein
MTEFETRLSACLEALREGRWDVDECLRRYPEDAATLHPHLLAAAAVAHAYEAQPRAKFVRDARQRFLVASGQHLQEAFDHEPDPSFFAAARVRFLMTAHKMKAGQREQRRRLIPFMERNFRPLAVGMAVLVMFLSFSTYTVSSASNALPGDWQYSVKLQTERVRLALAMSDGARRDVQLDIADERAHEIERLARHHRHVSQSVIRRMVDQTQPLVDDAGQNWNSQDLARLETVSERQKTALSQAQPVIDPAAHGEVAMAVDLSQKGVEVSNHLLADRPDAPPRVITPGVPLSALDTTPTPDVSAPPTDTPVASTTPRATPTAGADPSRTPGASQITVDKTPVLVRGKIAWMRLSVGHIMALIPSPADGWNIAGLDVADGPQPAPTLVKLSNADGTSLITLNPMKGDLYWFIAINGRFDEVQMRIAQADGSVNVADEDYLRTVYGDAAAVPLYVLKSIEYTLPSTATPEPSETPAAEPTATP